MGVPTKPIIAIPIDQGETLQFPSAMKAAEYFKISSSTVLNAIANKYDVNGYWFCQSGDGLDTSQFRKRKQLSNTVVLTAPNGEKISFPSQNQAAKYLGVARSAVTKAIHQQRKIGEFSIELVSVPMENPVPVTLTPPPMEEWMAQGEEIWKNLMFPELEHYQISNYGRVYNAQTGKLLNPWSQDGYLRVDFRGKVIPIHRLVAMHFLPPPPTWQYEINHKDCNKLNNHVSNLEWITHHENLEHAAANGLGNISKSVTAIPVNGGEKLHFKSINAVAKYFKIAPSSIRKAIVEKFPVQGYQLQCEDILSSATEFRDRKIYGHFTPKAVIAKPIAGGKELSFASQREAAEYFNVSETRINNVIHGGYDLNGHWLYYPNSSGTVEFRLRNPGAGGGAAPVPVTIASIGGERVFCKSKSEAARRLGVNISSLIQAMNEDRPIRGHIVKVADANDMASNLSGSEVHNPGIIRQCKWIYLSDEENDEYEQQIREECEQQMGKLLGIEL